MGKALAGVAVFSAREIVTDVRPVFPAKALCADGGNRGWDGHRSEPVIAKCPLHPMVVTEAGIFTDVIFDSSQNAACPNVYYLISDLSPK